MAVTRRSFAPDARAAQSAAKAAYFRSFLEGEPAFASAPLQGGTLPQGLFLLTVAVGTPPVDLPVIVDTGSSLCFVQGPDCTPCPGPALCAKSPFGGVSDCPYSVAKYTPLASSTASTDLPCAQCAAALGGGGVGCLGEGFSDNATCQFRVQFGSGNAAGQFIRDTVSVGGLSAGVSFGTTVFERGFGQSAGLFGFGPEATSLPFQLKQVGCELPLSSQWISGQISSALGVTIGDSGDTFVIHTKSFGFVNV